MDSFTPIPIPDPLATAIKGRKRGAFSLIGAAVRRLNEGQSLYIPRESAKAVDRIRTLVTTIKAREGLRYTVRAPLESDFIQVTRTA